MENPNEERPDGLEIISIGALYGGPWDKKYWSCSRGKDRYPYPIGYHAVQTHAGNTCRMEIQEGLKGPLFMVTSTDGDSCSGQTPDIAWELFQKKCGPRVKNWHGKRFSCKIDGVELFGFRNPFVQRLLRELVSNVNGVAERSLVSPNICNGASQMDHEIQTPGSCAYPDLLPYLGMQQSTGKRSRKHRSRTKSLVIDESIKRFLSLDILNQVDIEASKQEKGPCSRAKDQHAMHFRKDSMFSSKDGSLENMEPLRYLINSHKGSSLAVHGEIVYPSGPHVQNDREGNTFTGIAKNFVVAENPGTLPLLVEGSAAVDGGHDSFLALDDLPVESKHSEFSVEEDITSNEQRNLVDHENSTPPNMDNKISDTDTKMVASSMDADMVVGHLLTSTKDSDVKNLISKGVGYIKDLDLCIPDTLDIVQDNAADSALEGYEGSPCRSKDGPVAAEPFLGCSTYCDTEISSKGRSKVIFSETEMHTSNCLEPPDTVMQEKSNPVMCASDDVFSKELMKESQSEVGGSSGSSNGSSDRTDLDSEGQELARSMMTFLLPRALPLLKKTYKRKRVATGNREAKCNVFTNFTGVKSVVKNDETCHHTNIMSQGKHAAGFLLRGSEEKLNLPHTLSGTSLLFDVGKFECLVSAGVTSQPGSEHVNLKDVKSIVPDSLEDDQSVHDVTPRRRLFSGFGKADQQPFDKVEFNVDCSKLVDNNDKCGKESSNCYFGNDGCNEVVTLPDGLLRTGESLASKSFSACTSPIKSILLEGESNDALVDREGKISNSIGSFTNICIENAFNPGGITHKKSQVLNGEIIYNAEEENLSPENTGQCGSSFISKSEHLEKEHLTSSPSNNLGNEKVPKSLLVKSHSMCGSPETKIQSSGNPLAQVYSSVRSTSATIGAKATDLRTGEGTMISPEVKFDGKTVVGENGNPTLFQVIYALPSIGVLSSVSDEAGKIPCSFQSSKQCNIPLSDSICCRDIKDSDVLKTHFASKTLDMTKSSQAGPTSADTNERLLLVNEVQIDGKTHCLNESNDIPVSESMQSAAPVGPQHKEVVKLAPDDMDGSSFVNSSIGEVEMSHEVVVNELAAAEECHDGILQLPEWGKTLSDQIRNDVPEVPACPDKDPPMNSITNSICNDFPPTQLNQKCLSDGSLSKELEPKELEGFVELVGCYLLPNPVLYIFLTAKEDEVQICVICGLLQVSDRNLFIYKVAIEEQRGKCPSFLGYTSLMFPILNGPINGNIPFERSGLQVTPDGQSLVLLNSIKAPSCREQSIKCLCSICKSDCCEENAVKVVRVELGYVSAITKLTTVERLFCLLVCKPNHLVAVEESGRLHVWIMNSMWSANLEEFILPSFDYISPLVLELKGIPNCDSLIIGHNGLGGFGLWDISKRVLLARFSSPGNSIFRILPLGLFSWQKDAASTSLRSKVHIKEIIAKTNSWLSQAGQNYSSVPQTGEDMAVWLLVSASSDLENQNDHLVKEPNTSSVGWWRLALLAKNTVVLGSILDPRASAMEASAGHGIMGTVSGLVYMWELTSGKKLANLHSIDGGSISCIAADPESGALAVASNRCQLLLYIQSQRLFSR